MTKPKPSSFRAKTGRKTKRDKRSQDKILRMLAATGDVTPWQASLYTRCGYQYAVKIFREPNPKYRWRNRYYASHWKDS